jgi:hypothetical protein
VIYYSPVNGDVRQEPVLWRPKTAFIMQQLGDPVPDAVLDTRRAIDQVLKRTGWSAIDASDEVTGQDYLAKIWKLILTCPVGIALVHEGIGPSTLANIFYELGMLQAYGRETVVIRIGKASIPSDFIRSEWIPTGPSFKQQIGKYIKGLAVRETYYRQMAELVERNPLLAIDYLRRATLLSGDATLRLQARRILDESGIGERSKASVEQLMLEF